MAGTKKVFLKTFGCQMNVYDSERMSEALAQQGYTPTDSPESAELIILNTCHIREKAAEKVYSDLGRIRDIKEERLQAGQNTVIAVAGCVAQAEGKEIMARAPAVDLVIGPQSYHRLPDLVARSQNESRRIVDIDFPDEDKFAGLPARTAVPGGSAIAQASAFLTIQEGCDKFCTFCVVPYTRGMEYSRSVATIVAEAQSLVARGVRELTLLGQNVNAYHGEGPDGEVASLADLIDHLAAIDGLERLRYTTSHPNDMAEDLIAAHRDQEKLMPYLHLPFQSGSDHILAAMNRKHTADDYRRVIGRIREARPDIALSTDLIVGFPGETDEDFEATYALVEEIGFAQAFSFKYSSRPGTPAARMADQVLEDVKTERLHRLQALLEAQVTSFNAACVGKVVPVLFERPGRIADQIVGRSPYLQPVHVDGSTEYLGQVVPVEIYAAGIKSLSGVICTP